MICVIGLSCKKSDVKPVESVTQTEVQTSKNYNLTFHYGYKPSKDTLILKVNGVIKNTTYGVTIKSNDIIDVHYNPGIKLGLPDSNKLQILINNNIVQEYNCKCIGNYTTTLK